MSAKLNIIETKKMYQKGKAMDESEKGKCKRLSQHQVDTIREKRIKIKKETKKKDERRKKKEERFIEKKLLLYQLNGPLVNATFSVERFCIF